MVNNEEKVFVDRRTSEEIAMGLATPIRYWYDLDRKKRQRTNGVAVTLAGEVVVARSTCSRTDQFSRRHGRMVVAGRIQGREKASRTNRAQGIIHCWILSLDNTIEAYRRLFPAGGGTETGVGRTFNAIRVYKEYLAATKHIPGGLLG